MAPIQASLQKTEDYVYNILIDKRKKLNTKFQVHDLVRVADLRQTFSKGDTTDWSYKLYKMTQIGNGKTAIYHNDILAGRRL